ncbi:MAG: sulfite exporter TauE/SafE family protein [Spirochaetota bacterium]
MVLLWYQWLGIGSVGILQGFLNTVAGGGSFLALPALTFLGMDLSTANGTNRISILFQSLSGSTSFYRSKVLSFKLALPLAAAATLGATAGTFIAINVDKRILNLVIAALISVMAILLVVRPGMWEARKQTQVPKPLIWLLFFVIGVYGGFIQAGVGFFFTWALATAVGMDLVTGNAVKTVIIGTYTLVSLVIFFINGLVHIPIGLVLAAGSMVGASLGAKFTVAKGNRWVRWILAVVVVASAVKMVWDAFV